jgi:hypothetical protein
MEGETREARKQNIIIVAEQTCIRTEYVLERDKKTNA